MKILMSIIEAKFCLFDVEVKEPSGESSVFCQSSSSVTPEGFDSVDMICSSSKFVFTVMDSEMEFVSDIDEPIVSFPTICVDNTFVTDFTLDNSFKSRSGAIFEDVGENHATTFEHPGNWHLIPYTSASFASNSPCTKVALVDFDNTFERSSSIAFVSNFNTYSQQMTINRDSMDAYDLSNFSSFQIERKESI